jgi:pyruvate/2-oxoglutarate dehydrogenase complex dihydrolipoamide acyltransferase (E2) component
VSKKFKRLLLLPTSSELAAAGGTRRVKEHIMPKLVGRTIPISPFRRVVTDLMHFSQQVPAVTAERVMDLSRLVAVRAAASPRTRWTVLFTKAYAMLGRDYPDLRRAYLKCPRPRLYEHPHNIAALNVTRRIGNEDHVLFCLIRSPENRSLAEIDEMVRVHQEEPVETLRAYKRTCAVSRIPWPFRHLFWWSALNMFGARRCHNFGTFSVSSIAAQGAGLVTLIPVLTSALHYGQLDPRGAINVRITWDHRVMDGALVARILTDLESVLTREIVREVSATIPPTLNCA